MLSKSKKESDKAARNKSKVYETLLETRKRGYAVSRRERRVSDEISISVPIVAEERLLATLTTRFSMTAVDMAEAEKRFVPRLRAAAQTIGQQFIDQHSNDALISVPTGPVEVATA